MPASLASAPTRRPDAICRSSGVEDVVVRAHSRSKFSVAVIVTAGETTVAAEVVVEGVAGVTLVSTNMALTDVNSDTETTDGSSACIVS